MTALDAMRMALDALQSGIDHRKRFEIVTALRAAIAEMERAEPVMIYLGGGIIDCGEHGHHNMEMLKLIPRGTKLYTHPAAPPNGYQPFQHFGPIIPPPKNPNATPPQVDPNFPFGDEVFVKKQK